MEKCYDARACPIDSDDVDALVPIVETVRITYLRSVNARLVLSVADEKLRRTDYLAPRWAIYLADFCVRREDRGKRLEAQRAMETMERAWDGMQRHRALRLAWSAVAAATPSIDGDPTRWLWLVATFGDDVPGPR